MKHPFVRFAYRFLLVALLLVFTVLLLDRSASRLEAPVGAPKDISPPASIYSPQVLAVGISALGSLISAIGLFLSFRKEGRERRQASTDLRLKELQIAKLEAEIAQMKTSAQPGPSDDRRAAAT